MSRTRKAAAVTFLLGGALAVGVSSASAAPVTAEPQPGGVVVTATYAGLTQTIAAGTIVQDDTDNKLPGLCAVGVIHTSCTPADDVAD